MRTSSRFPAINHRAIFESPSGRKRGTSGKNSAVQLRIDRVSVYPCKERSTVGSPKSLYKRDNQTLDAKPQFKRPISLKTKTRSLHD